MEKEVYIQIHGRVQGIGFRYWAVNKARELGEISGWVRNVENGSVEILMSGPKEKIEEMIEACYEGPRLSRVDSVNFVVGRISSFLPPIEPGVFKRA